MHLTLRHFELVQAVHAHNSFTLAAKSLGLSQPALSRAVKALEEQIGGKLFEVREGGLVATPLAEVFIKRHETLRAPLEEILSDIDQLKSALKGKIVVGVGTYAPLLSVYETIAQIHQQNASIAIDLIERDWRDTMLALISGKIDLGVVDVSAARQNSQFEVEKLPAHSCGIYVRKEHPLATKREITTAELSNYSYCGTYPSQWVLERAEGQRAVFGVSTQESKARSAPITLHTLEAARQVVLSSDAFGIFPRILLHKNKATFMGEGLTLLNVPELNWLSTNYGMIWRRSRPRSPALEVFVAQLRAVESTLAKEEARLAITLPPPPLNHYSLTSGSARP